MSDEKDKCLKEQKEVTVRKKKVNAFSWICELNSFLKSLPQFYLLCYRSNQKRGPHHLSARDQTCKTQEEHCDFQRSLSTCM